MTAAARSFRDCLGRFATGVTVVSCRDREGAPCGLTANSFSAVSLEPPLILWNIAKVSQSLEAFLDARYFGVNMLTAEQEALSVRFAQSDPDRYDGVDFTVTERGVPRLADTLAWLECRQFATYDCGDHHIIVGEVLTFEAADGQPLVFYRGDYRRGVGA